MIKFSTSKTILSFVVVMLALSACSQQPGAAEAATAAPATPAREPAPAKAAEVVCNSCGVVSSISVVTREGAGTGVGAVIGGIVGGLAGNQIGGGDGKKIATVAGVVGGAVVGNKIEGNKNDTSHYEITVDMSTGGQRTVTVDNAAGMGIGVGSAVTVNGSSIALR